MAASTRKSIYFYISIAGFCGVLGTTAVFLILATLLKSGPDMKTVQIVQNFNLGSTANPIPNGWVWEGSNGANLKATHEPNDISEGFSAIRIEFGETTAEWAEGYIGLINETTNDYSNSDGIAFDVMGNFASEATSITFRWHLRSADMKDEFAQQDTMNYDTEDYVTLYIPWAQFGEFQGHSGNTHNNVIEHWSDNRSAPIQELGVAVVVQAPNSQGTVYLDNVRTYKRPLLAKAATIASNLVN